MANREASAASAAFDILASTREVLDRDMQKWWKEYTTKINSYRDIRNQSLCTNPEVLSLALDDIETNIEKVSYQINELRLDDLYTATLFLRCDMAGTAKWSNCRRLVRFCMMKNIRTSLACMMLLATILNKQTRRQQRRMPN